MKLAKRVEWLHRSSGRLMRLVSIKPDDYTSDVWWAALKREAWVHLKRSFELWWSLFRRKDYPGRTKKEGR